MTFNRTYFLLTILLLAAEVIIALYFNDKIIRPFVGDILVVMLVYCGIKTVFKTDIVKTAIGVLLFAFLIESLQAINFIKLIGLQDNNIARVILGSSFSWIDMGCYIAGILIIFIIELTPPRLKMNH